MWKLRRLETHTQEVLAFLAGVAALTIWGGSYFFLEFPIKELTRFTGDFGTQSLRFLFNELGYATLLMGLSFLFLGQYLIRRVIEPKDLLHSIKKIIFQVLVHVCILVVAASILTVIQKYTLFANNLRLINGAGGLAGTVIGGSLYASVGLFGSLVILIGIILVSGIISGHLELIGIFLFIVEYTTWTLREIKIHTLEAYDWLLEKLGWNLDGFSDSFLEFETATGTYEPMNHKPNFVHSFHGNPDLAIDSGQKPQQTPPHPTAQVNGSPAQFSDAGNSEMAQQELAKPKKSKRRMAAELKQKESETPADELNPSDATADGKNSEQENKTEILVKKYTKRYSKPDVALLKKPNKGFSLTKTEIKERVEHLESRLASFKLTGKIVKVHVGARLTMYEFLPDAGVKLSKIAGLANDLALLLGAESIRVLTPIPGKTTVGFEVPNKDHAVTNFSEIVRGVQKQAKKMALPIALGKNVYNEVIISSIESMPHMLICGTTGSGKSVFMNTLIASLLYTKTPKELRFLMIDPKMIELSPYNGIPHLLKPVVTDVVEAKDTFKWAEAEMDKRYQQFRAVGARNIDSFNEKIRSGSKANAERKAKTKFDWDWVEIPYIVIVVDELADLMITQGKEVEIPITRIAQKARAAGVHLVIATQRPSAEIITGLIKTNFPTRIAFKVSSNIDSRTILDATGAEKLLGNGDMLYMANGKSIQRMQGSFLSEEEVKKIVRNISD